MACEQSIKNQKGRGVVKTEKGKQSRSLPSGKGSLK
jgi:hypothetical protein